MGYDFRTAGATTTGSISPTGGPLYDVVDAIDYYLAAGVAPSRLILGVPYYGRVWTTADDTAHAAPLPKPSGGPADWSTTVLYETAAGLAQQHGRRWDGTERGALDGLPEDVAGCPRDLLALWFDDAEALAAKYDIVLQRDLRPGRHLGAWLRREATRAGGTAPRHVRRPTTRREGVRAGGRPRPGGVARSSPRRRRAGRQDAPDVDPSETAIGRLRILRGTRTVRSYPVAGAGGSIDWNGRDQGGGVRRSARIGSSWICGPPTAARHG